MFVDRDGVISEDIGYVHKIEDFKLVPNAIDKNRLNSAPEFLLANPSAIWAGMPFPHFLHWYVVSFSLCGTFLKSA